MCPCGAVYTVVVGEHCQFVLLMFSNCRWPQCLFRTGGGGRGNRPTVRGMEVSIGRLYFRFYIRSWHSCRSWAGGTLGPRVEDFHGELALDPSHITSLSGTLSHKLQLIVKTTDLFYLKLLHWALARRRKLKLSELAENFKHLWNKL